MLKKIIFLFCFFSIFKSITAQSSFYLNFKDNECHDVVWDAITLKNNHIMVALNKAFCASQDSSVYTKILILNNNGDLITTKEMTEHLGEKENIVGIHQLSDGYFVTTAIHNPVDDSYSMGFYNYDTQFKLRHTYRKYLDGYDTYLMNSYFDETNKKIAFSSNNFQEGTARLGTINLDCSNFKMVNLDSFMYILSLCPTIEKDAYIIGKLSNIDKIDTSLTTITNLTPIPIPKQTFDAAIKQYKTDKYISFSTESYPPTSTNPNAPFVSDMTCKIVDKNWKILYQKTLGKPTGVKDTVEVFPFHGLSWQDPNKIYVGWTTFEDLNDFEPIDINNSWLGVAQLDSTLNINWIHYYYGKEVNFLNGLVATSDGGVLLYGHQKPIDSTYYTGFVLKVDKNGLLATDDSSPNQETISVTVAPNPCTNYVTFALGLDEKNDSDLQIFIYDTLGRLVKKEKAHSGLNTFSMENLASGTYFYQVRALGTIVKKGKMIKGF
jgi:hypothetical protein